MCEVQTHFTYQVTCLVKQSFFMAKIVQNLPRRLWNSRQNAVFFYKLYLFALTMIPEISHKLISFFDWFIAVKISSLTNDTFLTKKVIFDDKVVCILWKKQWQLFFFITEPPVYFSLFDKSQQSDSSCLNFSQFLKIIGFVLYCSAVWWDECLFTALPNDNMSRNL